jgi:hypothetical protein
MIELLLRLVISMAVVMAVMAVAARLLRRHQGMVPGPRNARGAAVMGSGPGPGTGLGGLLSGGKSRRARPSPPIEVLYRRSLARGASITLVQAAGKTFLVGVTEQSVTLLTELTPGTTAGAAIPALQTGAGNAGAGIAGAEAPNPLPDLDEWPRTGRTPVCLQGAAATGRPENAWKLALDSLRERTVRR